MDPRPHATAPLARATSLPWRLHGAHARPARLVAAALAGLAALLALHALDAGPLPLAPLLPLYARLTTLAEAGASGRRRALLDLVAARPGVCMAEAARALGLTRNGVKHHVRTLARLGALHAEETPSAVRLYAPGARPRDATLPPALEARPAARDLVALLADRPEGLPRRAIHEALRGHPLRTRNHAMRTLVQQGILRPGERDPSWVRLSRGP